METAQRNALRKCRVRLVNDLMVEEMFDSIESRSLFTPIMLECIKAKESRPEKVRTLLDYLQRRGPDAFDVFIQCLRESSHSHIVNYLQQTYLDLKNGPQNMNSPAQPAPVPMTNNIYLTQETQGQSSRSAEVMQASNEGDTREVCAMEDSEGDVLMDENMSAVSGVEESQSSFGSTAKGTCAPAILPSNSSYIMQTASVGYTGNPDEEYRMESDPRGFLLIINNKDFKGDLAVRDGTDVDCDKLKSLFLSLGFGVDVRTNLTAANIKHTLIQLAKMEDLYKVDSLAVALLTHGTEEFLYGTDAKCLRVSDIFQAFTAEHCPALHHKPKFFIINACRGDAEDKGIYSHMGLESSTVTDVNTVPPEPLGESLTLQLGGTRIPNMKDFLVAYSTIPGHVSWRHMSEGSFFIQGFEKVFREHASTMDVLKMLVKVNNQVSQYINHQGVQIPAPQVMLTKTWYLNPPCTA